MTNDKKIDKNKVFLKKKGSISKFFKNQIAERMMKSSFNFTNKL